MTLALFKVPTRIFYPLLIFQMRKNNQKVFCKMKNLKKSAAKRESFACLRSAHVEKSIIKPCCICTAVWSVGCMFTPCFSLIYAIHCPAPIHLCCFFTIVLLTSFRPLHNLNNKYTRTKSQIINWICLWFFTTFTIGIWCKWNIELPIVILGIGVHKLDVVMYCEYTATTISPIR